MSRRNNSYIQNPHASPPPNGTGQSPDVATEWMTIRDAETMGSEQASGPLTPSVPTRPVVSATSPGVATEWMTIGEVENLREGDTIITGGNETRTSSGNLAENYRYLVQAAP